MDGDFVLVGYTEVIEMEQLKEFMDGITCQKMLVEALTGT